jgi:hypothetical protein
MKKQTVMVVGNAATGLSKAAPQLAGDHIVVGIDPAAPNGDHSAMAVIQGNRIHSIVFDELEKLAANHKHLSKMSGTVTGRITSSQPPLWNLPRMNTKITGQRYKHYLLRKLALVAQDESNFDLSTSLHAQGQPGDVMVTLSYMGKYRAYFWAGKKKRCWRRVDSRKYPDLMPQLRAALLLQA